MSFYTETIQKSHDFQSHGKINKLELLEPVTRAAVQAIIAQAESLYGIKLMVFETYRSQTRQTDLFNQGASKLKKVGCHHYGIACDLVKDVGGQPSWKGDFHFLQDLAKHNGLIWGGDWGYPGKPHSFVDADHVQRVAVSRQPALFAGNWYPDAHYDPYKDL